MALRSAKCYRKLEKPYTRVSKRKPRRSYVKGAPALKIHRFETGKSRPQFTLRMFLVSRDPVQIRHNALEAARVAVSKSLARSI
ncbi:MAG: ribosomal protein L16, partial [Candidatus Aenigmatarchaeota archaeon]